MPLPGDRRRCSGRRSFRRSRVHTVADGYSHDEYNSPAHNVSDFTSAHLEKEETQGDEIAVARRGRTERGVGKANKKDGDEKHSDFITLFC